MAEYFYYKNHKQKSKEFFNQIITLENSNENIKIQAEKNGVTKIRKISQKEVQKIEPHIFCQEALLVPSSGIIDAIAYMRSLVGKIEECGGMLAFNSKVIKSSFSNNKFIVQVSGKEDTIIQCNQLINSAGLFASQVASRIEGLDIQCYL